MTSDSDDALSWDGDDDADPRRAKDRDRVTSARPRPTAASSPDSAHRRDDALDGDPSADEVTEGDDRPALSTAALLILGVVGGVYLLYSVGWVVGGLRLKPLANFLVADAMFVPWFALAVAAPALWFVATWVLTRGRAGWIRIGILLLGVVLLVPWPFVTVGVIG